MAYKLCKFYENRTTGTPLRGVYTSHFDQISVKISFLGVLYPNRCTNWVRFGRQIWVQDGICKKWLERILVLVRSTTQPKIRTIRAKL